MSISGVIVAVLMIGNVQEMMLRSQDGSAHKRALDPQETVSKSQRVKSEDMEEGLEQTLLDPSQAPPLREQDAAPNSGLLNEEINRSGSASDRPNPPEPTSEKLPERRMVVTRHLEDEVCITPILNYAI